MARANRVEAVVRLCSGEVDDWDTFLRGTDEEEFLRLYRNQLRQLAESAKRRARTLIVGFNRSFFHGATEAVFDQLFREIKAGIPLGLRMPVSEFERRFVPLRREVERGRDQNRPFHATISITRQGLRYEYPEWHFANDLVVALSEARELEEEFGTFYRASDLTPPLKRKRAQAEPLMKRHAATLRWCVTACCSLLEAYLSALAWRVQQTESERPRAMSSKDRDAIEDVGPSFKDRLIRVPRIATGGSLWDEEDLDVRGVLTLKQTRDALMHPSPFSVPERYGGRDKLALIYELRQETVEAYVRSTVKALTRLCRHINGDQATLPTWLADLATLVGQAEGQNMPATKPLQPTGFAGG